MFVRNSNPLFLLESWCGDFVHLLRPSQCEDFVLSIVAPIILVGIFMVDLELHN